MYFHIPGQVKEYLELAYLNQTKGKLLTALTVLISTEIGTPILSRNAKTFQSVARVMAGRG